MQILLERNNLWNNDVRAYLYQVTETCPKCKVTSELKDMRKVSPYDLSSTFNDSVCIDQMVLENLIVFHIVETSTRFSHGVLATSRSVAESIEHFEVC